MEKRKLLFSLCLLLATAYLKAGPVTVEQARQKATQFLAGKQAAGSRSTVKAAAQELAIAETGRNDSYYIFNAPDNGGFVVVSGEDATEEILGYSESGHIDSDNIPCGMRVLLDGYVDQIAFLRENGSEKKQSVPSARETPEETFKVDGDRLTSFSQFRPYNNKVLVEGAPSGCVATAMAGLMYAHQWPSKTVAFIPSYIYLNAESYDFDHFINVNEPIEKGTSLSWECIRPHYEPDAHDDTAYAIAVLLKIVGASVKTHYRAEKNYKGEYIGSSAATKDVATALKKYFGYDESAQFYQRKKYSGEEWREMLREELRNNGPVVYCGYTEDDADSVSHAFLLEGYKGDYFYMNFGGGYGMEETPFLLDVASGRFDYPYRQGAVLHVYPRPKDEIEVVGLRFDDSFLDGLVYSDSQLRGAIRFHNQSSKRHVDFVTLYLYDLDSNEEKPRIFVKQIMPSEIVTDNFVFNDLTPGHRYVIIAYNSMGDEFWRSEVFVCQEKEVFAQGEEDLSGQLMNYEYWFDEDFSNRTTTVFDNSTAVVRASINTDVLSDGIHHFNFRVKRNDGSYSSVTSSPFLKLGKELGDGHLDYWLDDDYDGRNTLPLENTEDEQFLSLDLGKYPAGYHQLNMQVTPAGSAKNSTVITQGVLKLPSGFASEIEYWFDDNIANSKILSGRSASASNDYIIVGNLDFSGVSPGHHRLYYRARYRNGASATAIGSASVIVHSRYSSEATMASYKLTIDEGDIVYSGLLSGTTEALFNYVIDTSKLSEGSHTLTATFWNSYGISVSEQAAFLVGVTASEGNGDTNSDGKVDILDVTSTISHILGQTPGNFSAAAADVNHDNKVDIVDVTSIIDIILKK